MAVIMVCDFRCFVNRKTSYADYGGGAVTNREFFLLSPYKAYAMAVRAYLPFLLAQLQASVASTIGARLCVSGHEIMAPSHTYRTCHARRTGSVRVRHCALPMAKYAALLKYHLWHSCIQTPVILESADMFCVCAKTR